MRITLKDLNQVSQEQTVEQVADQQLNHVTGGSGNATAKFITKFWKYYGNVDNIPTNVA